ncbi:hypothetical protein REPUB_Repub12eG0086300 [Reevesia pubescens]
MRTLMASGFSMGLENQGVRCIPAERQALLDFKKGLVNGRRFLLSWTSGDEECCKWRGVGCDNKTGHVVMLNLHYYSYMPNHELLEGEIGSSLLDLRHLIHLDLSNNLFWSIPEFIGSLTELTYLNLSYNPFEGTIPSQLGNLSKLLSLDLNRIYIDPIISTDDLDWLSRLSSLKSLRMSFTNFTKAKNWLQVIQSHPSLSILKLHKCYFPEVDPSFVPNISSSNSLEVIHLTRSFNLHFTTFHLLLNISKNLIDLRLSQNNFTGSPLDSFGNMPALLLGIPKSLGNLCKLKILDLGGNNLNESLPIMLKNLSGCAKNSLEILDLSENQISGSLPEVTIFKELKELFLERNQLDGKFPVSFEQVSKLTLLHLEENQLIGPLPDLSNLSSLRELHLANNRLKGPFPNGIGKMFDLEILNVSSNSLNGVISEVDLSNVSKLKRLILSYNSVSLNVSSAWIPRFQLDSIQLASCKLGPRFPSWLRTQNNFSYLDISNSEILEAIPSWFLSLPSDMIYLNLSFNSISGEVSNLSLNNLANFHQIDLSSNLFSGSLPQISFRTTLLNLRGNKFSGSLSPLCASSPRFSLSYLDLSDNLLSGNLSDCWLKFRVLIILNLENNNFSGTIPNSIGYLTEARSLHLRNNNFSGEVPETLSWCTKLKLLDIGENKLFGFISSLIGEFLTDLVVLRLRSNGFFGNIPSTICNLGSLQILDLSLNNISGTIPPCLNNLAAMSQYGSSKATITFHFYIEYNPLVNGVRHFLGLGTSVLHNDFASIVWKGVEQEYGKTLGLLKVIDLSGNKLSGEIPEEMTSLLGLITLNLSRNILTGSIPGEIGRLKVLESFDLSKNHLSGGLPKGLADLSYLSVLDLSNNKFSGIIPTSTQLQSFNATSYLGNPRLCGDPLKKCSGDETKEPTLTFTFSKDEEWFESFGFQISMAIGFITGFWGVFGTIVLKRSWRHKYFGFLSKIGDWICLTIALKMSKLQRRLGR